MPSRRRARTKNLGTNLADVQRRMRYLERRPVRTKLQRKVVTAAAIAPETITADEVNFGTAITTPETDINNVVVQNPKDGLLVVSTTDGSSSIYSGNDNTYYPITDPTAQGDAEAAQEAADAAAADAAQAAADAAQAAADAAAAADVADGANDAAIAAAAAAAAADAKAVAARAEADAANAAVVTAKTEALAAAAAADAKAVAARAEADAANAAVVTAKTEALAAAAAADAKAVAARAEADAANAGVVVAKADAASAASAAGTAQAAATTALANAATAYTAAQNSLQPSAYAIQNPTTKQLSSIDATGLTVYTGASATSGPRVVLNSTGLAGFKTVDGVDSATFSISATTGAAVFSGAVTGATITGGTLNIAGKATIDAAGLLTATGATITGEIRGTSGYFGTETNGFSINSTGLVGVGTGTIAGGTISGTQFTNGSTFSVSPTGFLIASNAEITGTIKATAGYFGRYVGSTLNGFEISETGIVGTAGGIISGGTISGTQFTNGSTFSVSPTGFLIASNAEITGTIKATAGYFGTITGSTLNGWTISANSIVGSGTGTISGGIISGTQFTNGSTFSVSPTGFLIASNAEITGTIKSNAGYFGTLTNGFLIGETGLTGVGSGSISTTGNVGSFTGNTLTMAGGAISAAKVVSLSTTTASSDGIIEFQTDYITLSAGIQTEIFGAIKMSGSTTFYGFNNSIGVDTAVGGSSTKNIRNIWIRDSLISATSSSGNIGDVWLQYA
jgi:hypothetical protein